MPFTKPENDWTDVIANKQDTLYESRVQQAQYNRDNLGLSLDQRRAKDYISWQPRTSTMSDGGSDRNANPLKRTKEKDWIEQFEEHGVAAVTRHSSAASSSTSSWWEDNSATWKRWFEK